MHRLAFFFALSALILTAGCASAPELPEEDAPAAEESVEQMTRRLGGELLESIRSGSYRAFSSSLAGRTGFDIPKKDFTESARSLEEKYGKIESWDYLTGLKTPFVVNMIWKVRFSRDLPASGTKMEQDMLFRLVAAKEDGKLRVLALGFF